MPLRPRVKSRADDLPPANLAAPAPALDGYLSKIVKYIPVEVIGAYQTFTAFLAPSAPQPPTPLEWGSFAFLVLLCPLWIAIATRDPGQPVQWFQAVAAPVAFGVWVLAQAGGLFDRAGAVSPKAGGALLLATVLLLPLVEKLFRR